jgi:hypothetical protein
MEETRIIMPPILTRAPCAGKRNHESSPGPASRLVSAAELGEQSQYFEVQPNESDHQSEAAVPFHVFRGAGTGSTLDEIEVEH